MPDSPVYFSVIDVPEMADRNALGHHILRQMISALNGPGKSSYCIAAEKSGRPVVITEAGDPSGIYISLSHSGAKLACAATELGPIGVDIELPRLGRNLRGIAEAAFGPAEVERFTRDGPTGFYRIWTLREAIAKALGSGLVMVSDRIDRAALGPDEGSWEWDGWHLAHCRPTPDLSLALALLPRVPIPGKVRWAAFMPGGA